MILGATVSALYWGLKTNYFLKKVISELITKTTWTIWLAHYWNCQHLHLLLGTVNLNITQALAWKSFFFLGWITHLTSLWICACFFVTLPNHSNCGYIKIRCGFTAPCVCLWEHSVAWAALSSESSPLHMSAGQENKHEQLRAGPLPLRIFRNPCCCQRITPVHTCSQVPVLLF